MNSSKTANHPTISGDPLDCNDYIRSRLSPQPSDELYLHLADLCEGLKKISTNQNLKVLDYGCGGSPYRSLFPNSVYHRADYIDLEGLDFKIAENANLHDVPDDSYDIVLSTQVLEHVRRPEDYLQEARRILKPGGKLILTTHGVFYDHACPYDFRRWTADGLSVILDDAGFSKCEISKLTTNTRAIFFLAENAFSGLVESRLTKAGIALWLFREWFWSNRELRNRYCDKCFSKNKVVPAEVPGHPLYIALLAVAVK
jgi:SAM-dependent methyltransferase